MNVGPWEVVVPRGFWRITEPTTMLTDYALAALSAALAISLAARARKTPGRRVGLWIAAFSVTAVAALAGGSAHGFRVPLGDSWRSVWSFTVVAIGAGSALLIAAGVRSVLRPRARDEASRREGASWLERAVVATLAGLAVLVAKLAIHRHFNHNDLYHVIQMAGIYFLYRGALLLEGLSESDSERETSR